MVKKLIWFFIALFILFILAVFKAPDVANSLAKLGGVESLPQKIIDLKVKFDGIVTNLPSQEELQVKYNTTLSGALELKDTVIEGAHTAKGKVDEIRGTLSGAEQTVDELKKGYTDAINFIDETGKKIEETKKIIEDTSAVIENVKNGSQ